MDSAFVCFVPLEKVIGKIACFDILKLVRLFCHG